MKWRIPGSTQPLPALKRSTAFYGGRLKFERNEPSAPIFQEKKKESEVTEPAEKEDWVEYMMTSASKEEVEEFLTRDTRMMTEEEYSLWKILKMKQELSETTSNI